MIFRRISYQFALVLTLSILTIPIFQSCERDDDDSINGGSPALETTVTQVIVYTNDPSGGILEGVSVSIGNITVFSDNHGIAIFKNITVNKNRFTVKAGKTGYFNAIKGVMPRNDKPSHSLRFILNPLPIPVPTFNSTAGGTVVLPSGASVEFNPGSVADATGTPYSGTVNVYTYHFDPTAPDFETQVPGGDLLGLDKDGDEVALVSFGMMQVELRDPFGNLLNLMSGITAEITFPIAASQLASAPATIPLWYLDESTALWMEEGQATKQGSTYVGTVSHFSWWNCDEPGERADVTGRVIDCLGNPVSNAIVTIDGFMNVTTNTSGYYSTWVPAGWNFTYQVLTQNNPWLQTNSNLISLSASANQTNQLPDLLVSCSSTLTGTVVDCDGNPVNAYVIASQGSNYTTVYIYQGILNFHIPIAGQNTFAITSFDGSFDTTFNVVQIPFQNYNLGTIAACDSLSGGGLMNSMATNGGPIDSLIQFYPVTTSAIIDSLEMHFNQFGYDTPDSMATSTYELTLNIIGTGIGNHTISIASGGSFYYTMGDYEMTLYGSDYIDVTVSAIGPLGGLVISSFSGHATLTNLNTSTTYPVIITSGLIGCIKY